MFILFNKQRTIEDKIFFRNFRHIFEKRNFKLEAAIHSKATIAWDSDQTKVQHKGFKLKWWAERKQSKTLSSKRFSYNANLI